MKDVTNSQCQLKKASLNNVSEKQAGWFLAWKGLTQWKGCTKEKVQNSAGFQVQTRQQQAGDKRKRMESLGCRRKTALVCYQDVVLRQHKQDMSKIVWIIWTSFSDVKACNIKTTAQSVWVVRTFSWYGCSRFLVRSNRLCKKQCNHKN